MKTLRTFLLVILFLELFFSKSYSQTEPYAYAGVDTTICGSKIQLNADKPIIGSGEWSMISPGNITGYVNMDTLHNAIFWLGQSNSVLLWTVTYPDTICYDTIVITISPQTQPHIGYDMTICGDNAGISANEIIIGESFWSVASGSAKFEDSTKHITMIREVENGLNILTWNSYYEGNTCSDTIYIDNWLPSEPDAGPDQTVLVDTAQLEAEKLQFGIGEWFVIEGNVIFDNSHDANTVIRELMEGTNLLIWEAYNSECYLSDTVKIFYDNSSDIKSIENNRFLIYPNPGNNYVHIIPDKATINANIQIINLQGKIVQSYDIRKFPNCLDVSTIHCGIYFINILDDKGMNYTYKWFKE